MRVAVDHLKCAGLGLCEGVVPEVFEIGDDGVLVLRTEDVPYSAVAGVREAVDNCPTGALRLEDAS